MDPAALSRMLRLHVALGHVPLADVIEVRVALELLSVRLAWAMEEHVRGAWADLTRD